MRPSQRPSLREAVGRLADEPLHGANPPGRQLAYQQLAVYRVGWIVGGGQHVGGSTEGVHLECLDRTVGRIGHGGGEVRREVLGAADGLIDRVPTTDGIEVRAADSVDRPGGTHPLVERVRILQGFGPEEVAGLANDCHIFSVTGGISARQCLRAKLKPDIRRRWVRPSQCGSATCGYSENNAYGCLKVRLRPLYISGRRV